jgi:prophage regulatory protein
MSDPPSFLRLDAVLARCGISRSTLYRLVAEGRFPSPRKIGGTRISVWLSTDIDQWIGSQ